jgi:2-oxoglutarate dehydrogenase E1 component
VLIHGDAAVAGQGVNQEMLNFAQTRGYGTGGTVHIVVNNQIGFHHLRSARLPFVALLHRHLQDGRCADLPRQWRRSRGRGAGHPLAVEFRQEFKKDVVVDIVCFRKLGHNEQDEPMVTQPLMYKKIAASIPEPASSTPTSWLPKASCRPMGRTR